MTRKTTNPTHPNSVTSEVPRAVERRAGPLLAMETSTPLTRVVLLEGWVGGARLGAAEALSERHSSSLLRACVNVMAAAGIRVTQLGAIACGGGPGSFTGLRVGMSVAKGLALPTNLPLVVVSSLEALALDMAAALPSPASPSPETLLVPCIDAGKGQIFAAAFARAGREDGAAGVLARTTEISVLPQELGLHLPGDVGVVLAGPGAERYRDVLEAALGARARFPTVTGPTADAVGRRALERLARGERDDLAHVVPTYGRAPDITLRKPRTP